MPKRLNLSAILLAECEIVRSVESIENAPGIVVSMLLPEASSTVHMTEKQFKDRLGHYGIEISSVESTNKSIVSVVGAV